MQKINGVFEGGGVKGIAAAGAAAAALDAGYGFESLAGTSAGAMVAAFVAAGYTSAELRHEVTTADWPSMMDATVETWRPVGQQAGLFMHHGLHHGDVLHDTVDALLRRKGLRVFGDLPDGYLKMVGTDITHGRGVLMPGGLSYYGYDPKRFPVALAVRISASVPFFFKPVKLEHLTRKQEVWFADGALASRFPLEVVKSRPQVPTVGFRFVEGPHEHNEIVGPLSLATAVIQAGMSARETLPRPVVAFDYIVDVPANVIPLQFDLSGEDAVRLFDHGYEAAERWFRENNVTDKPLNRRSTDIEGLTVEGLEEAEAQEAG
jgi:NTE family protein